MNSLSFFILRGKSCPLPWPSAQHLGRHLIFHAKMLYSHSSQGSPTHVHTGWWTHKLDTRPRLALDHTYWLIVLSFPHFGFKLPQRSFSWAVHWEILSPLHSRGPPFHALKHQLGVHDNILDSWNEKAFRKGHLSFRAIGDSQNCYAVCPSLHSKWALSRADTSLYIMLGFLTLFYLSAKIWPMSYTILCWSSHLGYLQH